MPLPRRLRYLHPRPAQNGSDAGRDLDHFTMRDIPMRNIRLAGRVAALSVVAFILAGCGGSSGQQEGPPVAPAINAQNQDQLAKDVNAGAGSLGKGAPGVNKR